MPSTPPPPTVPVVDQAREWVRRAYNGEKVPELEAFAEDLAGALTQDELAYLSTMQWTQQTGEELIGDRILGKAMLAVAPRLESMGATAANQPTRLLRLGSSVAYADENPNCTKAWDSAQGAVGTLAATVATTSSLQILNLAACALTGVGLPVCMVGAIVLLAAATPAGVNATVAGFKGALAEALKCAFGIFDDESTRFDESTFSR